ncbi:glycosyltransferase [Proteocatella sphenisci]|uniref:glycosyltransferase n=1 Tax=Proteocatella sphenisci TaxID=181070 RepID=UPI0004B3E7CE|nr:glycosyltransferase [Proteocatella sphenisci]
MKLSIPMMVKNESKYLEQVLMSLQPIRDAIDTELIIVDTGSEDNTVEIAKRFTDKVFFHQWNNDFSEMRNITLDYAKGEWLLIIDGDEVLENPQPIIEFLMSKKAKKYNTGFISAKNIINENDLSDTAVFTAPKLFRNMSDFRFTGAIHNQPNMKLPYYEINSIIVHYGYMSTDKDLMEKKFQRTSNILKQELEKDPENIYYWYQLSVTYRMHNDDNLAIEPAEKAYNLLKDKKKNPKSYIYVYKELIAAYLNNKEFEKAEIICDEVLQIASGYVDLHFFAGKAKLIRGKLKEAAEQYELYIDVLADYDNSEGKKDATIISYTLGKLEEAYYDLVITYEKLEEYKIALEYAEKIISENYKNKLLSNVVNICTKLSDYQNLKKWYESIVIEGDAKNIELIEMHIENIKTEIDENQKHEIEEVFSDVSTNYAVINLVGLQERNDSGKVNPELLEKIAILDFSKLPLFYGKILYYLLKKSYALSDVLSSLRLSGIRLYLDYFIKAYPNYHDAALKYIKNNPTRNLSDARINREIEKYALVLEKLEGEEFRYMLERYIEDGAYHITGIYHPDIIENEIVSEIKEDDEEFLLYLYKGRLKKNSDPAQYIRYLKKAIHVFPFKKAIEVLKDEVEQQLNPPVNEEMEILKKQFKENIKILIAGGMLEQAEEVIRQYEQIISSDEEILLFKSHISLIKLEEAKINKKAH